jgi:aspartyl-tRNA(Asn)/glutamyl-tRNA(Gln) amidotransferase subunit A
MVDAAEALSRQEVSSVELTDAVLRRASETEAVHHAYVFLDGDLALTSAAESDARRSSGSALSALDGVPVGVKDLFLTADMPTRGGCHAESDFVGPRRDDHTVAALRATGAVLVGKQTTHHFGSGRCPSACRNAVDPQMFSGGSSAGSAVSVALGSSYGALGSDGGGSVRAPAALNGIVGLMPSSGAMPERVDGLLGPTSYSSAGLLCRSVADVTLMSAALLPGVGEGSRSADREGSTGLAGLRVGVVGQLNRGAITYVTDVVGRAVERIADSGAILVEGEIPELDSTREVFDVIAGYEVYRSHREMLAHHRDAYCDATLPGYLRGAEISDDSYREAKAARLALCHAVDEFFERHQLDMLIGPTTGKPTVPADGMDAAAVLAFHAMFTMPVNLMGRPALSMPCGDLRGGLPVGLQAVGSRGMDGRLLAWSQKVEAVIGANPRG